MEPEIATIVEAIREDADELDRESVESYCQRLCALAYRRQEPIPFAEAREVMRVLQGKRWFDLEEAVGEVLVQTGQNELEIRRRLAQALIEQGKLVSAQLHLQRLIAESRDHPREHAEARGLLGRAFKQRYVDANEPAVPRNAQALRQAIATYGAAYDEKAGDPLWFGINLVACVARARRDGVTVPPTTPDHRELARTVLELAAATFESDADNPWAAATALEACVALDDAAGALEWAERYVTHKDSDAFEVGSTLRQLTYVWQLGATTSELGARVLLALQSGMLKMADGAVDLSTTEVRATPELQRKFGLNSFVSFPWYARGLQRAQGVACITDGSGTAWGTGFLMPGKDVAPRWEREPWVLLTSDHVVNEYRGQGLKPREALVSFEALTPGKRAELHEIDAVLWGSRPSRLDVAVIRLKSLPSAVKGFRPYRVAATLPEPARPGTPREKAERIYVIGHPQGRRLRFSIHDNRLLARDEAVIHYRTPTEPGSSGSPVFNRSWELIGIHHAGHPAGVRRLNGGRGRYDAHEGISIAAIRNAIREELGG